MAKESTPKEQVISIDDIKKKAEGYLVEIPDWEPNKTINVRLRAIDITPMLLESGAVPDELSVEVATMFEGEEKIQQESAPKDKSDYKMKMKKFSPVLDAIAKQALAEPTWDEINEVYPLTMQQKLAIFKSVTAGIEKMKPFRT